MSRKRRRLVFLTLAAPVLLAWLAPPAFAFIQRLMPLQEVLDESAVIVTGRIESVDRRGQTAVMRVEDTLKGRCPFSVIRMNFGVGQQYFPEALTRRLRPGDPIIFFYQLDGQQLASLAYHDGIFFQFFGDGRGEPDRTWWNLTHVEVHMNRTFDGSTAELTRVVRDVLAGRGRAPAPRGDRPALERDDIMGLGRPPAANDGDDRRNEPEPEPVRPAPAAGALDGLEDHDGWSLEAWGNRAEISLARGDRRGAQLRIGFNAAEQDKVALSRVLAADWSDAGQLVLEARNDSDRPVRLAIGLWTGEESQYFESRARTLPPGAWRFDLAWDLAAADFKSGAVDWRHRAALADRDRVRRLTVLVYGHPAAGTVLVDRLRVERRRLFVRALALPRGAGEARGAAWADYDGDGDLDALVCHQGQNRLFRNDGGEFVDATGAAGLSGGSRCAGFADYDGDGDPDLFYSSLKLWTNDGGRFRDDSELLPRPGRTNTEGAGWLDADGDGRPDLMVTNGEHGICLFRNTGEGEPRFESVGEAWGLDGLGRGNGDFLSLADWDGDGYPEFLYNLERGVLARNEEGERFVAAAGSGVSYRAANEFKLGAAFGDCDNDGDLDLFVPQREDSRLFINNNDFTFGEAPAKTAGDLARLPAGARTAAWGDLDGDGLADLVVGFAERGLRLYRNAGADGFGDWTDLSGLGDFAAGERAAGLALADFDGDGDLDLLVNGEEGEEAAVLVNGLIRAPGDRVPLAVVLPGAAPGATVRLYDRDGRLIGQRQLALAANFSAQGPPAALFAVAPGEYRATVVLTDGAVRSRTLAVGPEGETWLAAGDAEE